MGCILKGGGGLYPRMRVGAVILAAGEARRMQGINKLALEMQGVPLLKRTLIALSGAGVDEVVVVLGHYADALEPLVHEFPVTIVRNERYAEGQMTSVRAGLAALRGPFDAVVMCLGDQPLLNAADIQALIGAYKKRDHGVVVVPRVSGKRGNPIIFDWAARDDMTTGDLQTGCRQFIERHPEQVDYFDSDNDHYVVDLDTPEDIRALETRLGLKLGIPAARADVAA
jgi:CTP:molybdopterin cytidylyltransferase MocA